MQSFLWCKISLSNDCRWECDRLAKRYRQACSKLQLTPGQSEPGWDVRVPWPPSSGSTSDYCLPHPFFDPSINPFKFGYGNWCGQGRPGGKLKPKPVDTLDSCCMYHDINQGTHWIGGTDGCAHCLLISCARKVECNNSPFPDECRRARLMIGIAFGPLCDRERAVDNRCWFV